MTGAQLELIEVIRAFVKEHGYAPTVREIAEATQRSESGIKMTLLRLREQLSDCIQRQLDTSA